MRPKFEKILSPPHRSFVVEEWHIRRFDAPWHFHPELELTSVMQGRGRRFVGDSIESFVQGDLVLLGPNLPHFWHSEGGPRAPWARSIVVQFRENFLGPAFLATPELAGVRRLMARASRGLCFTGRRAEAVAHKVSGLANREGLDALTELLRIFGELSTIRSRPLASESY